METNEKIIPLIERIFLFIEDGEWGKASEYCEKVLDLDAKNPNAYLGKLMIECHIREKTAFSSCKKDFEKSKNFQRIIQYGNPELVKEMKEIIKKRKEKKQAEDLKKAHLIRSVKQKVHKAMKIVVPIILMVSFIGSSIGYLCYNFFPKKDITSTNPIISELEYKGLTIKMPVSDNYTAKVVDEKIYLSGKIEFTINEFLSYVYPPSGKSFYATGWAKDNGNTSFLIKDYGRIYGDVLGSKETVDIQFYGYSFTYGNDIYSAKYAKKDGSWPSECTFVSTGGTLSATITNRSRTFDFESGQTVIIGQYEAPKTTVEIVVVNQ